MTKSGFRTVSGFAILAGLAVIDYALWRLSVTAGIIGIGFILLFCGVCWACDSTEVKP